MLNGFFLYLLRCGKFVNWVKLTPKRWCVPFLDRNLLVSGWTVSGLVRWFVNWLCWLAGLAAAIRVLWLVQLRHTRVGGRTRTRKTTSPAISVVKIEFQLPGDIFPLVCVALRLLGGWLRARTDFFVDRMHSNADKRAVRATVHCYHRVFFRSLLFYAFAIAHSSSSGTRSSGGDDGHRERTANIYEIVNVSNINERRDVNGELMDVHDGNIVRWDSVVGNASSPPPPPGVYFW